MTERPILFSAPMVRAILNGSKTMTRRAIKPQPFTVQELSDGTWESSPDGGFDVGVKKLKCPYGEPGDRLWVRESFWEAGRWEPDYGAPGSGDVSGKYWKKFGARCFDEDLLIPLPGQEWRRIPSIHMPRVASRILLEISSTRIERLKAISQQDAKSEGVDQVRGEWAHHPDFRGWGHTVTDREVFEMLWNIINGDESWDANPYVWVVEFRRVPKGEQP